MKPEVLMRNASIFESAGGQRLRGEVKGHPRFPVPEYPEWYPVITTAIIVNNGTRVETRNTVYIICD